MFVDVKLKAEMKSGESLFNHDDYKYKNFIKSLLDGRFSASTKEYIQEVVEIEK